MEEGKLSIYCGTYPAGNDFGLRTVTLVDTDIDYEDIRHAVIHQPDSIAGLNNEYKYTTYDQLAKQIERQADEARNCARLAILRLVDRDYLDHHEEMIRVEFSDIVSSSSLSLTFENRLHLKRTREMVDELKELTELINTDILHLQHAVENEKMVDSIKWVNRRTGKTISCSDET